MSIRPIKNTFSNNNLDKFLSENRNKNQISTVVLELSAKSNSSSNQSENSKTVTTTSSGVPITTTTTTPSSTSVSTNATSGLYYKSSVRTTTTTVGSKSDKVNRDIIKTSLIYPSMDSIYEYVKIFAGGSSNNADNILRKYNKFANMMKPPFVDIGINTNYTVQGICNIKNDTFITAYKKGEKPIIKYVDCSGKLKEINLDLPNGTHAGGISYDSNSDSIFVSSSSGKVAVFSRDSIVNSKSSDAVKPIYELETGLSAASYLTCYDNKLYVGTFKEDENGTVKEFSISKDGKTISPTEYEFKVPEKVQGISFYKNNEGKETMAISQSYGRTNDSNIILYDFDHNEKKYVSNSKGKIDTPPMLEQISFNEAGNLNCIFESGSKQYNTTTAKLFGQPVATTCYLNINSYLS